MTNHHKHTVLEMTEEASERDIDSCKLIYLGHGLWDDEHIQINYQSQLNLLKL
ncbi:hypothetical protein [Vagococcus fessus]|uniref:hypothetical protein n=1 Tax=Vagococcus fessus TaxID=120370 RepID=UPI001474C7D6|nr:hypothetical protein [Vagococcus fessus]